MKETLRHRKLIFNTSLFLLQSCRNETTPANRMPVGGVSAYVEFDVGCCFIDYGALKNTKKKMAMKIFIAEP